MTRLEIIQMHIDKYKYKTYLEIGAAAGDVFLNLLDLEKKTAVDTKFMYPLSVYRYSKKRDDEAYYEMTSDQFFHNNDILYDIIFIDGAHSYFQVARDVKNSFYSLKDDGVIILHDCNPPHRAAAIEADSYKEAYEKRTYGWTGEWCGDVWKIALLYPNIRVIDCDYGVGILKKQTPIEYYEDYAYYKYEYLEKNREEILNLVPVDVFTKE